MAQDEKIFANGFSFKRNEKAPDFVVGRLSILVEDAIFFMREHEKKRYVNLNIKIARAGNYYIELDTYEPREAGAPQQEKPKPVPVRVVLAEPEDFGEELPF